MTAPPHEVRIACVHADRCGGCPLIERSYGEQLAEKGERVAQSLIRYPALELVRTEDVVPANPIVGYRTRAKLIAGSGGRLGLFAKGGGHEVVDIPHCRVLSEPVARVVTAIRERLARDERDGGALAPCDASGKGCVRAVDVRETITGGTARVLVTFVVQRDRVADIAPIGRAARELMEAAPVVAGVACNFHNAEGPQVLGGETVPLAGVTSLSDEVGASVQFATFGSFVQAHRGQTMRVHAMLTELLGLRPRERANKDPGPAPAPRPRILDLYGGSGAIALGLAARGAEVVLVESFAPAAAQARAAAQANGLSVRVECADVAGALVDLAQRGERFDAAVINPPRRGMSPTAREWLARLAPPTVAYVSCDPETLARDLDHLDRLGHKALSVKPLDMIPLTEEIETIAVLHRTTPTLPKVLYEDAEILVVDKGPHEPTTPQGEYAGSLLARVRALPGAESAVPVQRLDVGASGLVLFARTAELVAKWDRVFASDATRLVCIVAARGVTPSKGVIARALRQGGRVTQARTRYRRLAIAGGHSVLRVVPEQGTAHQVRRHLAAIDHPVLGDERYGESMTNRFFLERHGLDRPFLHAVRLELSHPTTGARHLIEAPLPGDLRAVVERMSGGTLQLLEQRHALGTSGASSFPPAADDVVHTGGELEIDLSTPTMRPPEPAAGPKDA
ncbi:MAG TPA: pseudouridine synthase [Polyangiaceae bacterium]|jgi:23S rRNA (uracil1939-C5)-methyltransferase